MQNFYSPLPYVPFTVLTSEMTFEDYLEYQSWRIEIQVFAMLLVDQAMPKSKIIDQLVAINRRAARFPQQPLPEDSSTTALECFVSEPVRQSREKN
jgi:hypothetical protein